MEKISQTSPAESKHSVACPECAREFTPRGLAGHRRLAHGLVVRREPAPPSALPGGVGRDVESAHISPQLERIESRIARVESLVSALFRVKSESEPGTAENPLDAARAELVRVREEIARVKARAAERALPEEDAALTAEQDAERRAAHKKLGELSRTQFMLLLRMGEHAPGASRGTDFSRLGYF